MVLRTYMLFKYCETYLKLVNVVLLVFCKRWPTRVKILLHKVTYNGVHIVLIIYHSSSFGSWFVCAVTCSCYFSVWYIINIFDPLIIFSCTLSYVFNLCKAPMKGTAPDIWRYINAFIIIYYYIVLSFSKFTEIVCLFIINNYHLWHHKHMSNTIICIHLQSQKF